MMGIRVMNDDAVQADEEDHFSYEVSDEALETAAGNEALGIRRPGRHRHRKRAVVRGGAAARARTVRNRCSSKPPPPMCSRSSAVPPSTCAYGKTNGA